VLKSGGKGEATRAAILDQALEIASADGLEGLSLGTLAAEVGMSKSGLFAHFRSKEQLQLSALARGVERFVAKVVAPAVKAERGEPRVRALFDLLLRWDRHEFTGGCVLQTAVVEFDDHPGPVRDFVVETQRDWFDTLTKVARAGVESRAFKKDLDARLFAFELANIFLGYRRHARLLRDRDAEKLAKKALDELLERARA
jgi:AcrR family transcriptional regulator